MYNIFETMKYRFVPLQAASSILLVIICIGFSADVDKTYKITAWCNAIVSTIYNGVQVPCINTYNIFLDYEVSCSFIEHKGDAVLGFSMKTWKQFDLFFVCFICLYTGSFDKGIPLFIIITVCFFGALFGQKSSGIVVALALVLTSTRLHLLSTNMKIVFWLASIMGPVFFFIICPNDCWPWPYRFPWHGCCAVMVYCGSQLNTRNM